MKGLGKLEQNKIQTTKDLKPLPEKPCEFHLIFLEIVNFFLISIGTKHTSVSGHGFENDKAGPPAVMKIQSMVLKDL